jgi:hypothetical protein
MSYKPGDSYYGEFTTSRFDTGAATNADSLPVATATHNGADDGSFTLTVANLDTGRYKVTGTIPSGYASGDSVQISVAAAVNSVTGKAVIADFQLDSKRLSDLIDTNGFLKVTVQGYVAGQDPATWVLDAMASAHSITNSIGGFINQIPNLANVLSLAVPGSWPAGSAGQALGRLFTEQIVTLPALVSTSGAITFVRGDDYYAVDGRSFDFTDTTWPDLTSCVSVTFHLWPKGQRTTAILTVTMSTVSTGTGSQTVRLEMSKTNTGTTVTDPGKYDYDVVATLANGHIVTLRAGAAMALSL